MFDSFLLSELEIVTSNKFKISGKLYKEFYSSDKIELLEEENILLERNQSNCFQHNKR